MKGFSTSSLGGTLTDYLSMEPSLGAAGEIPGSEQEALYHAFMDLKKAFDRVPPKVIWSALRKLGVEEWMCGKFRE